MFRGLAACAALCLLVVGVRAGEVPRLKARVGSPVVQELMGGCSLTCSFPWDASAGADNRQLATLNDARADTAWTSAKIGDKLTFRFPADLPRVLNGTPFYGIDVVNGAIDPLAHFKAFGRVKELLLSHNGRALLTIRLADTYRWQRVEFDDIYLDVGDTLSLEILAIYPGKTMPTAAITEIVLQGAH